MKTIIFDIETISIDFSILDGVSQSYLMKWAKTEEEVEKVKQQMALWAPTNKIVAIGMLSVESEKGAVYYQTEEKEVQDFEENNVKYSSGTEKEILAKFWQVISHCNRFVTFNGRNFDCPVVMLRSAIQKVKVTKNLVPYRYSTDIHIDLLEQLTFYGASRKFNLDIFCKSFGIKSPKAEGITGHDVKPMFEAKEYKKIAKYCAGDLFATRELYLRWLHYMKI